MTSPKISTYEEITPLIYSWSTPDVPKYAGWEKIGYTEQESSDHRIAQQASQMGIEKIKNWSQRAIFTSESGGRFTDREFHDYLARHGIARDGRLEWFDFNGAPRPSRDLFLSFAGGDYSPPSGTPTSDYTLRPEQAAAVEQAYLAFASGYQEVLWNAKPRFGKTLTSYDLMRQLEAKRVLVVTNRPAVAASWYDDFVQFIGHQTNYHFISESPSLEARKPLPRSQWAKIVDADETSGLVEFVSLQDLKGSKYFGGGFNKLRHIAEFEWDLLIIDEAHEGVDTTKTDVAFDKITRKHTLHMSGTPFRALASGRFTQEQIYNWTYLDEQVAKQEWDNDAEENPYTPLPTLNMLTYQVSRMITDQLDVGMAVDGEEGNIDYTFDLGEFFSTKDNGYFTYEADVIRFLDMLTTGEKYPFSTPELRDEIRHSFWLLDRVASAKALERILKKHEVFGEYEIVLAAGDGKSLEGDYGADEVTDLDSDLKDARTSLDKVHKAIAEAEKTGGKTITLSVGQLTTGVTVPEWTAVLMLSNVTSPAKYMQAAFRAQNPCTFERAGRVLQKKNSYIFDFAPERTLVVFDEFANNLSPNPSGDHGVRQGNIRELLNFLPILGEDSSGEMIELDAAQVLTFPQVFKAKEVVRRGFLSNLLFDNVAGIFRYSQHFQDILNKLPEAKQGKVRDGQIEMPEPPPVVDQEGKVQVPDTVINPKVAGIGKPVFKVTDLPDDLPEKTPARISKEVAEAAIEVVAPKLEEIKEQYSLTVGQMKRDERQIKNRITAATDRVVTDHTIEANHLADAIREAPTETDRKVAEAQYDKHQESLKDRVFAVVDKEVEAVVPEVVKREETKKEQTKVDQTMEDARAHLRGFARTIPMFLMAYGDRGIRLANFDDYTPDEVFEEITGITEEEFRTLRDGQTVTDEDGNHVDIPGLFDGPVFDRAIQEFLDKKEALADYFDEGQIENIFAYIPQQKTSLVFTPEPVVELMMDTLEKENPGIFSDPTKTFADLFSTAGLFLMEILRRLDKGLTDQIPDRNERLKHILTKQVFEMSHNEILHKITIEAVSGGVPERKAWIEGSGHFQVGNLAKMSPEERQRKINAMLEGN